MTHNDLGSVGGYTRAATLADSVRANLEGHVDRYDVPAIVRDYRDKINAALSGTGISLDGDRFYGEDPATADRLNLIRNALNQAWTQVNPASFERFNETPPTAADGPRRLWWKLVITDEPGGEPISVDLANVHLEHIATGITSEFTEGELLIYPEDELPAQHEALVDLAVSLGVDAVDLMGHVHDVHDRDASQVNTNGLPAQIGDLLDRLGVAETEAIIRAAADDSTDGAVRPEAGESGDPRTSDAERVLRVVVGTTTTITDDLCVRLSELAEERDATVTRCAPQDLHGLQDLQDLCGVDGVREAGVTFGSDDEFEAFLRKQPSVDDPGHAPDRGFAVTMASSMHRYPADCEWIRGLAARAGLADVWLVGMRVVAPNRYEQEADGQ